MFEALVLLLVLMVVLVPRFIFRDHPGSHEAHQTWLVKIAVGSMWTSDMALTPIWMAKTERERLVSTAIAALSNERADAAASMLLGELARASVVAAGTVFARCRDHAFRSRDQQNKCSEQ